MSGYYQRKIINFFLLLKPFRGKNGKHREHKCICYNCFGYSYHNKQPVTKSRFQILVLCGMEFSYITFYLFFGNIDKMQDSHFEIWHPYCIHLVWLWQDNSQPLTNHSVRISIIMWAIILSWIKLRKRSCNLSAQHCLCLFWSL